MTDLPAPMPPFDLTKAFEQLQRRLLSELGASDVAFHPTAKGDNTELNWIAMLRGFLPQRYQVDRAFVVDVNGEVSDQLDVVIYDAQYSPLLFRHKGGLYIPAESVYASFESKPELSKAYVDYAASKVASVRRLERTSAPVIHAGGRFDAIAVKPIVGGILATRSAWTPAFGDPLRTALDAHAQDELLDLGCAPADGAFAYSHAGDDSNLETCVSEKALLFFAMHLFRRLQQMGTVPAIDMDRWGDAAWG